MLSREFYVGAFSIEPLSVVRLRGIDQQKYKVSYDSPNGIYSVAYTSTVKCSTREAVIEELYADSIFSTLTNEIQAKTDDSVYLQLENFEGKKITGFRADCYPTGMERTILPGTHGFDISFDNRDSLFLVDRKSNLVLEINDRAEFDKIRSECEKTAFSWIKSLLREETLTENIEEWDAPTFLEIRHVVGQRSFTGITGARAATLVGISPQNFRKYTALDTAKHKQKMSFAMWHMLLHKLGVKKIS